MLERTEFTLSRAAITIGIAAFVCLGISMYWWWRVEHTTPPSTYFDQTAWNRVNQVLTHVQPSDLVQTSNGSPSICSPNDRDHPALLTSVLRLNEQLAHAKRQQFLQKSYVLNTNSLLQSSDFATFRCRDILPALMWLTHSASDNNSTLQTLNWKERLPFAAQSRLPAQIWVNAPQPSWTVRSPWAGLPGCIFWTHLNSGRKVADQGSSQRDLLCQSHAQAQDALPTLPGQAQLLSRLAPWRIPQNPLYERLVGERNRIQVRGNEQAMGLSVQLTLDPQWQKMAQQLSDCYTGRNTSPECDKQALDQNYFEKARVRLAGISVIDISSGRVLVAASASSPCHAFDQTRNGNQPRGCPSVDEGTVHRPSVPQEIINHALFTQAPPGSLVKPIMMAGILSQSGASGSIDGIDTALMRSDSQRFLDAFLCRQRLGSGTFQSACQRPEKTLDAVHRLGWNTGCNSQDGRSLAQCGKLDLLHGVPLAAKPVTLDDKYLLAGMYQPIQWTTLMGQMLVSPHQQDGFTSMADMPLGNELPSPDTVAQCARSGKVGYSRCKGQRLGIISEAYGQGNARATPVGVAGMLAALANSSQDQPQRYPHLLEGLWLSDGNLDTASDRPLRQGIPLGPAGLPAGISQRIITAMEKTHTQDGTAYKPCSKVMGANACNTSLGIAGKTGTPGDVDQRSLTQLHKDKIALRECLSSNKPKCSELYPSPRPRYRWYAALFKSNASGPYDKAIAVLVHSNWRSADGRFADDNSAAAEMAMRFIQTARASANTTKATGRAP
jgi:hypothetical protein